MARCFMIRAWLAGAVALLALAGGGKASGPAPVIPDLPATPDEGRRFLTQATFGPSPADLAAVSAQGYSGWIDGQLALPASLGVAAYMDQRNAQFQAYNAGRTTGLKTLGPNQFYEAFYGGLADGAPDALRQRLAFALSQIMVVSMQNSSVAFHVRSAGSYYDTLLADAFGSFRTLLQDVTLHPAMGIFLSTLDNQKENPARGTLPDENYAREVMQLFTIGLNQLNADGSLQLDPSGNPIPTFSHDDVAGLAKVFTGWGWYAAQPTNTTFWSMASPASETTAMTFYPNYHSTSAKAFLGVSIPASATADPAGDLKVALDAICNHPNVGPFFGYRLIQQLVTSNPSPAYVGRVAAAFADNGAGVRGDLGATLRAVLLDPEARSLANLQAPSFGKLREPVLRLTQWMRAFGATSQSGYWELGNLDSIVNGLGQSPLNAPGVFNFWTPAYGPPLGQLAANDLLAPEFQIVDEVSVAGYMNFMENVIPNGLGGGSGAVPATTGADIQAPYVQELALAGQPAALVADLNDALMYGTMSTALQGQITQAITAIAAPSTLGAAQLAKAYANRVSLGVYLTMASPEYLHQR